MHRPSWPALVSVVIGLVIVGGCGTAQYGTQQSLSSAPQYSASRAEISVEARADRFNLSSIAAQALQTTPVDDAILSIDSLSIDWTAGGKLSRCVLAFRTDGGELLQVAAVITRGDSLLAQVDFSPAGANEADSSRSLPLAALRSILDAPTGLDSISDAMDADDGRLLQMETDPRTWPQNSALTASEWSGSARRIFLLSSTGITELSGDEGISTISASAGIFLWEINVDQASMQGYTTTITAKAAGRPLAYYFVSA